jgi:hypothetical protein
MTASPGKLPPAAMSKPDNLDGSKAVRGEIVELDGSPSRLRRTWLIVAREAEIKWLPVGESAFLLWVLAVLLGVWLAVGFAFGLI